MNICQLCQLCGRQKRKVSFYIIASPENLSMASCEGGPITPACETISMPKPHIDVSRWHSSSFLSNQHSQPLNIPICCVKQDFLAHRLICCFGILLPSYSICYTIPPCCTGRRRWPQKLLHLPSWMTPRWLHTIRKAGDVKNGWHKYDNYVIHTGCMVKKKVNNWSKTHPHPILEYPLGNKIRHITCHLSSPIFKSLWGAPRPPEPADFCVLNWWFWNRLRHTWPMAAIAVALYKDIYIYRYGCFPKIGGYILQNGWFFCFF